MIAYALFGVMAMLTFLSISGSLIHILKTSVVDSDRSLKRNWPSVLASRGDV